MLGHNYVPQAVVLLQCSQLQEMDLADYLTPDKSSNYGDNTVDALIVSYYYWDVVNGKNVR